MVVLTFFMLRKNVIHIRIHIEGERERNCHTKNTEQQVKNIKRDVTFSKIQIHYAVAALGESDAQLCHTHDDKSSKYRCYIRVIRDIDTHKREKF